MTHEALLVTQFLAAGLMLLLGAWLLWIDFGSRVHRAFSIFLLLRALVIVANQMPRVLGPDTSVNWPGVMQFCAIAVPFALAYFLVVYFLKQSPRAVRIAGVSILLGVVAVELLFAWDHSLGFETMPGQRISVGPLSVLIVGLPFAYGLAGLLFALESSRRAADPGRNSAFLLSAAFVLNALAEGTLVLAYILWEGFDNWRGLFVPSLSFTVTYSVYFSGLLPVVASLWIYARDAVRNPIWAPRFTKVALLVGLVLPSSSFFRWGAPPLNRWGAAFVSPGEFGFGDFVALTLLGIWRLFLPCLAAYALLKYRLFNVDLKLKAGLRNGTVAAAFFLVFLAAYGIGTMLLGDHAQAFFVALVSIGPVAAGVVPLRRLGARFAEMALPAVEPSSDYLEHRRIEIYMAALEDAKSRRKTTAEDTFIRDLRSRLGITPAEHRAILLVLESRQRASTQKRPGAGTRFRIERELGRGSQGRVLLAHDAVLDRKVVLKQPLVPWILDADGRKRFLQEARLAARIRHPNVVTLFEVQPDDDPPTLILEYVAGGSLEEVFRRRGKLPALEAGRMMVGVLSGLQAVHAAGILHRDLKPANILLDSDGVAKVTDFGVARPPAGWQGTMTVTAHEYQPGSLVYMSPEQARGETVDARSDLFSVGCVLYRALTGRHYFDFKNLPEHRIRQLIQSSMPGTDFPEIPSAFGPILERSLAKQPSRRYPTAREMGLALGRAIGEEPVATGARGVRAARRKPLRVRLARDGKSPPRIAAFGDRGIPPRPRQGVRARRT